MDSIKVAGLDILAAKNGDELAAFLISPTARKTGMLVAINAEKVVLAKENPELAGLLQSATYKYADGISIVCTIKCKVAQYRYIKRVAGVDLWEKLMWQAKKSDLSVFLLGASESVLSETVQKWQENGVNIVGYHNGYFANDEEMMTKIQQSGAKFVSVAMGSPKQELFMQKALNYYPDCLYMGVGGSYDVFAGKVKRAPRIWQELGLEWLYRILKQPTRWRRQVRLGKFIWLFLTKKL